jgi:hypothetical protein
MAKTEPNNIRVRLPKGLHTRLHKMADEQGVPLSTLVTVLLGDACAWRPARRPTKSTPALVDHPSDMLPGASREGAFRLDVVALCDQEFRIRAQLIEDGAELVPKDDEDREALLASLAAVWKTAAWLGSQLQLGPLETRPAG